MQNDMAVTQAHTYTQNVVFFQDLRLLKTILFYFHANQEYAVY